MYFCTFNSQNTKLCIYNLQLYKTSQNTHFYNPVSTVQCLHPSTTTTTQLLQSDVDSSVFTSHFRQPRFDSPIFTIQSWTSISLNIQGVSKYFFEKSEQSILEILNEKSIMHSQ